MNFNYFNIEDLISKREEILKEYENDIKNSINLAKKMKNTRKLLDEIEKVIKKKDVDEHQKISS